MKVSPGQQQLILASEYLPARRNGPALDDILGAATRGATLKHLTVLASRPDSTVVWVHADYDDAAPGKEPAGGAPPDSQPTPAIRQGRGALVKLADQSTTRSRALAARGATGGYAELAAARYAEIGGAEVSMKGLHIDVRA